MNEYKCNTCGHTFTVVVDVYDVRCQRVRCDSTNTRRLKA